MTARRPLDRLPYFDELTKFLDQGQSSVQHAFGQHVHWGYWPHPERAGTSAEEFGRAAEALTVELCREAAIADGQRVLDAGCGFGGTVMSLDSKHRGMHLLGLNIDRRQLVRARAHDPGGSHNILEWVQADACRLPFPDRSFDRILAVECIFHYPDRRDFFQEAFRTLTPGGRLTLSDFVPTSPLRPLTSLIARWPESIGFYGRCDLTCSLADYRSMAGATGFRLSVERDITRNTLPTYRFLRALRSVIAVRNPSALLETAFAEIASRLGALRYVILAFDKPE
jgi:SAM-dependent methyltransferase